MSEKVKKIKENFITSNIFLYNTWSCVSKIEKLYPSPDEEVVENIKIYANKYKPIRFAYESKIGLVRLNDDGSAAEKNILGKLLAIDNSSIYNYFKFFETNGFLLPISFNSFDTIEGEALRIIINRLHATLELMSTITDMSRTSYEKIVRMILFHIFSPVVEICTESGEYNYVSRKPSYTSFLENALDLKISEDYLDTFNNESFTISDSVSKTVLSSDLIEKITKKESDEKYNLDIFQRVFHSYLAPRDKLSKDEQRINDFLFHYLYNVGVVESVNLENTFYYRGEVNKNNFSVELKSAAMDVAKIIIRDELEFALKNVHPSYNTDKLEPTWKIDSLLSALYFGLFYMRPTMETYRRCANPKCGEFFLVSRSSSHKKYCCKACQNREMSARKRARDKIKETTNN